MSDLTESTMGDLDWIETQWARDSVIDPTSLDYASLNTPKLHAKYYRLYHDTKLKVIEYQDRLTRFQRFMEDFYDNAVSEDEILRWEKFLASKQMTLPDLNRKVLKPDISKKISAHKYHMGLSIEIAKLNEKAKYLESILGSINRMSFEIRNAIEFIKIKEGIK